VRKTLNAPASMSAKDAPGPRDSWTEGTPHFHSARCYEGALSNRRAGGRTLTYR
jgi:hypothetical protein